MKNYFLILGCGLAVTLSPVLYACENVYTQAQSESSVKKVAMRMTEKASPTVRITRIEVPKAEESVATEVANPTDAVTGYVNGGHFGD